MKRSIEPLGNSVLVLPQATATKTETGLFLPETQTEKPTTAFVVASGPGRLDYAGRLVPTGVKPGDAVIFSWIHAQPVSLDGTSYLLVDACNILGIIRYEQPALSPVKSGFREELPANPGESNPGVRPPSGLAQANGEASGEPAAQPEVR